MDDNTSYFVGGACIIAVLAIAMVVISRNAPPDPKYENITLQSPPWKCVLSVTHSRGGSTCLDYKYVSPD